MKFPVAIALLAALALACNRPPLSEKRFARLLVDVHTADALLTDPRLAPATDQQKQAYYNALFEKHHTTREEFDDAVKYYAATERYERVYENVARQLNRRDTTLLRAWQQLTRHDTVNLITSVDVILPDTLHAHYISAHLLPVDTLYLVTYQQRVSAPDTLPINNMNPHYTLCLPAELPGHYQLQLRVQFTRATANSIIKTYITAPDADTLHLKPTIIRPDANPRDYTWNHNLVDTIPQRQLHLRVLEPQAPDSPRQGQITNLRLYRKYLTPKQTQRTRQQRPA
ncbi:MAG: DUF4296 domain-containing protein [Odoribacteraceae bacterium]|jgi:hypothetical protein|nr:DUF4296 domain-containing protein [Odoribacteraceae bacterium]